METASLEGAMYSFASRILMLLLVMLESVPGSQIDRWMGTLVAVDTTVCSSTGHRTGSSKGSFGLFDY